MVTREVRAVTTESDTSVLDASVHVARLGHIEEGYCSFFVPTSLAYCLLKRNTHIL